MSDDVLILPAMAIVLAAPGLGGYAVVARWTGASPWRGWVAGAAVSTAFWAACWALAFASRRETGSDDGSEPMALAVLVASIAVNAVAAVALHLWRRRAARSAARRLAEAIARGAGSPPSTSR